MPPGSAARGLPARRRSHTDLLDEWSRRHGDYDLGRSRTTRAWLHTMHTLARPLAALDVPPVLLTGGGVVTAAGAVAVAGHRRRLLAALLVGLTGLLDGLDGAVALQRGVASDRGRRLDHAADRVTDALFAAGLLRAGAPRTPVLSALVATTALELRREQWRARGRLRGDVVTVGERPTRVLLSMLGVGGRIQARAAAGGLTLAAAVSVVQVARVRGGLV